jgi:hypothetical protein
VTLSGSGAAKTSELACFGLAGAALAQQAKTRRQDFSGCPGKSKTVPVSLISSRLNKLSFDLMGNGGRGKIM